MLPIPLENPLIQNRPAGSRDEEGCRATPLSTLRISCQAPGRMRIRLIAMASPVNWLLIAVLFSPLVGGLLLLALPRKQAVAVSAAQGGG